MRGAANVFPAILVLLLSSLPLAQVTRVEIDAVPQIPPADTAASPVEPALPPSTGSRSLLDTLVIDPGHGGDDVGARGTGGSEEKALTLSIAQRLKATIEMRLGIRVILTRDDDRDVGLDERAAVANNSKADVFLSLHLNAALAASTAGAEVSHLRVGREGERARRTAAGEAVVLPVFGGATRTVDIVRWDLAHARHADESAALAGILEEQLRLHVPMSARPIRELPLRVLTSVDMPAALIEMAYLSNPEQERLVQSEEYQGGLVQAVFDAVLRFRSHLEERGPR